MSKRSKLLSFMAIAGAGVNALAAVLSLMQGQAHLVLASIVASALCLMVYQRFIVGPFGLTLMYLLNLIMQITEMPNPATQAGLVVGTVLGLVCLWGLWLWDEHVKAAYMKNEQLQAKKHAEEQKRQEMEAKATRRAQRSKVRRLELELAKAKEEAKKARENTLSTSNALVP